MVGLYVRLRFNPRRRSSQIANRNLRRSEFRRVADIPSFKSGRIGFDVKLQSQGVRSISERLVFVVDIRCKPGGAVRQIERVAVPMKYGRSDVAERFQA